ncbi:MAG: hypothetical protein AB1791_23410 [Chloroflexota bacterium]
MDNTAVIIVVIFAVIVVAAFAVYRRRSEVKIRGPLGTGLELKASNKGKESQPGVKVEDATSRRGGLLAEDKTGRGVDAKRIDTADDILLSSSPPSADDPKA